MIILGIETSCDETGVCIIQTQETKKGQTISVLGNQLYSQVAKHAEFGGVFPMLAKREHAKNLVPLFKKCLEESHHLPSQTRYSSLTKAEKAEPPLSPPFLRRGGHSDERGGFDFQSIEKILVREPELFVELKKLLETIEKPNVDAIAVTNGPGLEPALWVGVTFAKALSTAWNIPIIPTNHMEGHIVVAMLDKLNIEESPSKAKETPQYLIKQTKYPALTLLISGGHTQLVLIKGQMDYKIIGNTRDDAVGEAFDKVARMLGLPYPGGPQISIYAEAWKEKNVQQQTFKFPRPMINSKDLDFSFSGLKTSVLYTLREIKTVTEEIKQEIAYEFKEAVIEVLISKTKAAILEHGAQSLIVGGGVIADKVIRGALEKLAKEMNIKFLLPEISASTDNALMIAVAGFVRYQVQGANCQLAEFKANGNLSL